MDTKKTTLCPASSQAAPPSDPPEGAPSEMTQPPGESISSAQCALLELILAGEMLDDEALALAAGMDDAELQCVLSITAALRSPLQPLGAMPVLPGSRAWISRHGPRYYAYTLVRGFHNIYRPHYLALIGSALHAAVLAVNLHRQLQEDR